MPTYKTTNAAALAAYWAYFDEQCKLQDYFDMWAPRFGMTKAVLRERAFDCTYFDGFRGDNPTINKIFWRDTAARHDRPGIWWVRSVVPRGQSNPTRTRGLRNLRDLWREMHNGSPQKAKNVHGHLDATPWVQLLGFNNHLDFFNHGRTSMVFTRTAILLKLEHGVPPKLGEIWEEILGSEYERLAAENAAELARERAEKEAANAACDEMTRQNQELGLYD